LNARCGHVARSSARRRQVRAARASGDSPGGAATLQRIQAVALDALALLRGER
jgi:hypothetical protein